MVGKSRVKWSNGQIISGDAWGKGWLEDLNLLKMRKNLGGAEVVSVKIRKNTLTDCEQKANFLGYLGCFSLKPIHCLPIFGKGQFIIVYCLVGLICFK